MRLPAALMVFFFLSPALYAEKIEFFEKIEFRGAKNLDRYDVIRMSRAKADEKGIIIDTDSLKEVLEKNIMVKNSSLSREGNSLVVEIVEKYPLFTALLVDKQQSIPVLLDEKMNIVESGLFFRTDMPIIILSREYADSAEGKNTLLSVFELLMALKNGNGAFADELEEVMIDSPAELKVKLRKRKTLFVIKNELNGFLRLEKTAAYLDASARYPEYLDLRGNMVLVR
ncbi:MAG TPA: hypothetical protein PK293_05540 [Spirochaetota bacterium]|nr:hypothetical protein [Spirochaetota bacterium]HPF05481.1 hypothetical protein [Spirochaetota bacterium]